MQSTSYYAISQKILSTTITSRIWNKKTEVAEEQCGYVETKTTSNVDFYIKNSNSTNKDLYLFLIDKAFDKMRDDIW